ncbi:substrate-binding periplasmic protein [Pseudaeromonas pectinilytica]
MSLSSRDMSYLPHVLHRQWRRYGFVLPGGYLLRLLHTVLSSLLLLSGTVFAQELPPEPPMTSPLRVGVLHIPPLAEVRSPTNTSGPLIHYMHRLLQSAGLAYRMEGFPARRLYRNLAAGESQFWVGVKNVPEYEGKVLYSEQPVYSLHLRLYRLPGTPEIRQLSALQTQRLIVIRGYSYGGLLEPLKQRPMGLQWKDANTNYKALEMLQLRRGDYLLSYAEPIEQLLQQRPQKLEHEVLQELPMYLVLSRATPHAESLMARLNQVASDMRLSGETRKIFAPLAN